MKQGAPQPLYSKPRELDVSLSLLTNCIPGGLIIALNGSKQPHDAQVRKTHYHYHYHYEAHNSPLRVRVAISGTLQTPQTHLSSSVDGLSDTSADCISSCIPSTDDTTSSAALPTDWSCDLSALIRLSGKASLITRRAECSNGSSGNRILQTNNLL